MTLRDEGRSAVHRVTEIATQRRISSAVLDDASDIGPWITSTATKKIDFATYPLARHPDRATSRRLTEREPRVVIAHDYLTQRGGAERVVLALLEIFPNARLLTSIYNPDSTYPEFRKYRIEVTPLQRFRPFRVDPRRALPFLAPAWSRTLVETDLVICSSGGWSHGIRSNSPKIVYCHNPPRWLYQTNDYLSGTRFPKHFALKLLAPFLRRWDVNSARTASAYLANSTSVADRIESAYDRKALVLAPPTSLDPRGERSRPRGVEPGFLLAIGRARGYKNIETIVRAMSLMPEEHLVVVGSANDIPNGIRSRVTILSSVTDSYLRWLYANAKFLVACSFEDFGLTPIEAFSFGTPAAVLKAGGYLDTMIEGVTGEFIQGLTPGDIARAVGLMNVKRYDRTAIMAHAQLYDHSHFESSLRRVVAQVLHTRDDQRGSTEEFATSGVRVESEQAFLGEEESLTSRSAER